MNDYQNQKEYMVKYHIKQRGINNPRILDAFLRVPRHLFIKEELRDLSYNDYPLDIGHNQTISQPYIVAYMLDKLHIKKTDKVLEIGTGSGYQTALLAELANEVYTLEIIESLQAKAKDILSQLGYENIVYSNNNGYDGWVEHAPYDKIIVSAAPDELPINLVNQLIAGGIMIVPVGHRYSQTLYLVTKSMNHYSLEKLDLVRFVPMNK